MSTTQPNPQEALKRTKKELANLRITKREILNLLSEVFQDIRQKEKNLKALHKIVRKESKKHV